MIAKTNLKVSIIMPVFNRSVLVARALRSCIDQTYADIEVIVVDDASTDDTVAVVQDLQDQDSRIKLLQNKSNQGPAKSRNTGLTAATGDLITFLDSDDYLLPEKIAHGVAAFQHTQTDLFVSVFKRLRPNGSEKIHENISPQKNIIREFLTKKFRWSMIVPVWRRQFLIEKVGLFNERLRLGEDFEFHFRAILASPRISYSQKCLTVIDDSSSLSDPFKIRTKDKRRRLENLKSSIRSRTYIFKNAMRSNLRWNDKLFVVKYYLRFLLAVIKQL